MPAYLIAQVNIINEEPYKEYLKQTSPLVKKYNGEFIVRGGKFENVYGKWGYARNVIIKFSTYEIAMEWYNSDEYKQIKKIREENSECNVVIIDGV